MIVLCETGWCFRCDFWSFFLSISFFFSSLCTITTSRESAAVMRHITHKVVYQQYVYPLVLTALSFLQQDTNERRLIYAYKVFLTSSANDREHYLRIVVNYGRCTHIYMYIYIHWIHLASTNKFRGIVQLSQMSCNQIMIDFPRGFIP
jgi:hypothetical protein